MKKNGAVNGAFARKIPKVLVQGLFDERNGAVKVRMRHYLSSTHTISLFVPMRIGVWK